MKLYVGNLAYNISQNDLNELFGQYGEVVDANLVMDRYSGRSKGFAFIEMATRGEGHKAMETLNGSEFQGRPLVVNEAKPQTKKGGRRR